MAIFAAAYDLLVLAGQGVLALLAGFVLLVLWAAAENDRRKR
jgi:hypothetical protein